MSHAVAVAYVRDMFLYFKINQQLQLSVTDDSMELHGTTYFLGS
jgi:hypothetical protein